MSAFGARNTRIVLAALVFPAAFVATLRVVSEPLRVLGAILLLPGLFIVAMNLAIMIHNVRGGKYSSPMPFVALPFLAVGILLLQIPAGWWFLLLVDISSVLTVVCAPLWLVHGWRSRPSRGE